MEVLHLLHDRGLKLSTSCIEKRITNQSHSGVQKQLTSCVNHILQDGLLMNDDSSRYNGIPQYILAAAIWGKKKTHFLSIQQRRVALSLLQWYDESFKYS